MNIEKSNIYLPNYTSKNQCCPHIYKSESWDTNMHDGRIHIQVHIRMLHIRLYIS